MRNSDPDQCRTRHTQQQCVHEPPGMNLSHPGLPHFHFTPLWYFLLRPLSCSGSKPTPGQPSSLSKLTWEHQKPKTGMNSFQRTLRSTSTTPWSLWRRFTSPTSFHFQVWLSSSAVSREDTLQHSTPKTPGWLKGNDK